ncbi:hypothetical protein Lal_00015049 [Lupinus albus]|nr:hypothetical protein Lal_00015049 [Lupinus albus]
MSVNLDPGGCLRHRCSSTSLRISLLHVEFYPPLPDSSLAVSNAIPRLSPGLSRQTYKTACARFTPSTVISPRAVSSLTKELYNPKAFFTHAALLDQACAHCPKFPTAASRRSLGRVSVPVWLVVLSDQLLIVALRNFRYVIPHFWVRSDVLLTRSPLAARLPRAAVRLACVKHAASVQSEPGSNSSV